MPPAAKSSKKPEGVKDIRGFFAQPKSQDAGASSSRPSQKLQPTSSSGSSKPLESSISAKVGAIEISDDDELPKPVAKKETPADSTKTPVKRKKALIISSDEEDEQPLKKKTIVQPRASTSAKPVTAKAKPVAAKHGVVKKKNALLSSSEEEEEEEPPKKKPAPKAKTMRKKDDSEIPSVVKKKPAPKKANSKLKAEEDEGGDEEKPKAKPKFDYKAAAAKKAAGPSAPGSKEVPDPEHELPLRGLSFVFTGELSSFSREEAGELAKRFGGRVVGTPSGITSYVVLGADAGQSKLNAIKKHGLETLDEDGFLNLIATRKPDAPTSAKEIKEMEKANKKADKDKEAILKAVKDLEKQEKALKTSNAKSTSHIKQHDPSSQLWTTKYAPQTLKEICGNKKQVENLGEWLREWPKSLACDFKKPGKNCMGTFRAVLISGSPGIGKTTTAHLVAKLAGYTPIEVNASNARSKKLVENATNINNTSLDGWFAGKGVNEVGAAMTDRSCLIMDEVDGMSSGDRGGIGALNALIKKTKVPIICIANDRGSVKMKPLGPTTFGLKFSKPEAASIRSRILSIAYKEKMKIPANVIDQLVTGSGSDIRQVLNMLSTWKLSNDSMDFNEGKALSKSNEKYSMMSPFDIANKMLGPYMFSHTSRETLSDKMELYFHDPSLMPLMVQENYLKTSFARIGNEVGHDKEMKMLRLMDQAASSISDGDLVDAMLHGPEMHWGLMPLHAASSTIRPAYFTYGSGGGYGGPNPIAFPQWLGQNSKQGKLSRQLTDVQIRMRLKVSGDKAEIRQSYLPALIPHIVTPLQQGAGAIDNVIGRMDEYYLTREDWDAVVELGVGDCKDEIVLKLIPPATKSAFTRKYNSTEHPIPFRKNDLGKPPKKIAASAAPDLEEAFDVEEDDGGDASEDEAAAAKKAKKGDDIKGDKFFQAAKKKAPGKKVAKK